MQDKARTRNDKKHTRTHAPVTSVIYEPEKNMYKCTQCGTKQKIDANRRRVTHTAMSAILVFLGAAFFYDVSWWTGCGWFVLAWIAHMRGHVKYAMVCKVCGGHTVPMQ